MEPWRCLATGVLATLMCYCLPGCSRHWFRQQADRDAINAISEKGGHFDGHNVYAEPISRLYDPYSADCPPMPPDDPQSHELMHCVDGKWGYKQWGKFGRINSVESPFWLSALPMDQEGVIRLDLRDSVRIARVNSRSYQQNRETLYLSALNVSFERFRFDYQFFAGNRLNQNFRGRDIGASSITTLDSFTRVEKLSATGGEMVVGFANALVWDSWGSGSDLFTSTIDFTLLQPLLRFGGRARVMEGLTQSERNLLANVRQMEQFRQGFYVDITTGRNPGSGPSLGSNVGQAGLGLIAGLPSGRGGAAGGYLGLLQVQQRIRNQASNVAELRDSLSQLEAAFEANRISSRLQVDQARQALLNAQSSLLAAQAAYESRVDSFKLDLGLPPELPIEISDPLLDRFVLIDPTLTQLQNALSDILLEIRQSREQPTPQRNLSSLEKLSRLDESIDLQLKAAISDLDALNERLPERKQQLRQVAILIRELGADVDRRVYDVDIVLERIEVLAQRLPVVIDQIHTIIKTRRGLAEDITQSDPQNDSKEIKTLATKLSDSLLELSLVQAEIRLQGIGLLPIEIDAEEAVSFARLNRLDWMNARANLVDAWRKIEFFANDLKSNLDVVVDGQLATRPDNVLDFDKDLSRIRLGLRFDTPTARLAERNRYRASQIRYQQARRDYTLFEDRVSQSLRNTLRIVTLSQINLEVRRVAVQVAIAQVDIARLRLNPPVRPNQPSRASPTAARDLVSALSDLLDAQNDLLDIWVSYEVLRVLLDFEMGTMQLDPEGIWMDPGPLSDESPQENSAIGI